MVKAYLFQPPLFLPPPMHLAPPVLSNHLRAVLAVFLSLKKKPVIRWERMSQAGRKLAVEVQVGKRTLDGADPIGRITASPV